MMNIEMENLGSEAEEPFLSETAEFRIHRQGFWTYAYEQKYPQELRSRISSEHYYAILNTVSRIHSRYQMLPVFVHCVALFIVFSILEIILSTALFTPLILTIGLLITVATPIIYGLVRITSARDQQIASVSAFLDDANVEFRKIGLRWEYASPARFLVLVAEEFNSEFGGLESFAPDRETYVDDPWMKVTSQTRCTCLFIEYNELEDSQALSSSNIPYSSRPIMTCRISLFPSGRIRFTAMVALMDVKSSWLKIEDLHHLALKKDSEFSIWEPTHVFTADKLLDLLVYHLDD